jgi:enhancing lycopene biosynthesis protein 2
MMMKVAMILSGCGHLDGAEIRETVLALLSLDKAGVEAMCWKKQHGLHEDRLRPWICLRLKRSMR